MVSIQTNSTVSFGVIGLSSYSGRTTTTTPVNERPISNIKENNLRLFSLQIQTGAKQNVADQNALFHFTRLSDTEKENLTYDGTPISELSVEDAKSLVDPDGYFGIDKTSQRIADFVLNGAGDDIEQLKAGREGVLNGFAEAEKAWGGKLPEISYDTLAKSLEAIDEKIGELGGSVVDLTA